MIEFFSPGHRGYLVLSVLIVGIMFLTACGGGSSATGGTGGSQNNSQTPAPTVSINASATQIVAGSSVTLTVTASNATQVVISDNCDSQTYHLAGNRRNTDRSGPDYAGQLYLHGDRKRRRQPDGCQQRAITVQPSTATTVSMTPPQQTIAAGQPATLQCHRGECQFGVHHQQRDQHEHICFGSAAGR